MATTEQATVAEVLLVIASEFERDGHPLQAIKSLEAICQSSESCLPQLELKARIQLASLLLKYTDNGNVAKQKLEPASTLVKNIHGMHGLKCKYFSQLAECYDILPGHFKQKKTALKKGLEIVEIAAQQNWPDAAQWECHFQIELTKVAAEEGDRQAAIAAISQGKEAARRVNLEFQMICALGHAQLCLSGSSESEMKASMQECAALAPNLPADGSALPLQLHSTLLKALLLLRQGATSDLGELSTTVRPMLEQQLAQLLQNPQCASPHSKYSWLSPAVLAGTVHLVAAISYRPAGKFANCAAHLNQALALVEAELERLAVLPTVPGAMELDMNPIAVREGRMLIRLKFYCLENTAFVSLTQMQMKRAQAEIAQAVELCQMFPTVLAHCHANSHLLVGQYAHSLGIFKSAMVHFTHARKLALSPSTEVLADILLALAALCDGNTTNHSKAQDALVPLARRVEELTGANEQAAVLFVSGIALVAQEDTPEARVRLMRALRLSHGTIGNHQVVQQCLCVLGGLSMVQGEVQQATDMLKNAHILAKNLGDPATQMLVLEQPTAPGHHQPIVAEIEAVKAGKKVELDNLHTEATANPLHKHILEYVAEMPEAVAATA
eukprot:CAMPEP_0118921826 /NCGR_PEP_ID=MMETSP1169-20130426/981_1 /TAXON_ID=36882 /ORGANISM="Pyramimonas obovata, Strain CCMP722" /LENGTH=612 /DNA_ID=CAMNT_0006862617 /DNA_START=244 /DNA_END=2082 /DNA_ORIENTATION=-